MVEQVYVGHAHARPWLLHSFKVKRVVDKNCYLCLSVCLMLARFFVTLGVWPFVCTFVVLLHSRLIKGGEGQ